MNLKCEIELFRDCDGMEVEDRVINQLSCDLKASMESKIDKKLAPLLKELMDSTIQEYVKKGIEDGIQLYNEYGDPRGEKVTFEKMILQYWSFADHYSKESRLKKIIKEEIDRALRGDIQKELNKIHSQVKQIIDNKLVETIKNALKASVPA